MSTSLGARSRFVLSILMRRQQVAAGTLVVGVLPLTKPQASAVCGPMKYRRTDRQMCVPDPTFVAEPTGQRLPLTVQDEVTVRHISGGFR